MAWAGIAPASDARRAGMTPAGGFFGIWPAAAARWLPAGTGAGAGSSLPAAPATGQRLSGAAWPAGDAAESCWTDGGDFALAFHGELYNHGTLCGELQLDRGVPLPRLLRALWQRWGLQGLQRLDGVYALAVSDAGGLLLHRDPSGLRNLYCHAGAADVPGRTAIAFATHLDTLLRLPGVPRRLARRSLHEYLRFLDIAAPNTLFEAVVAVEAGQLLRWPAGGGPATATHSEPSDVAPGPQHFDAATDLLDEHLRRSVQARLAGASRPAAFLSGGIDSALLCALAGRECGGLTALTVGFDSAPYDETPVAQRIAGHLGIAHHVLRFDRPEYLQAFETLAGRIEQPMADPAAAATVLAYEHCRSRHDVVLDGMGADEAVGALPPRHVRLAVAHASLIPRPLRRGLTRLLQALPGLAGYAPLVDFEHPAETMIRWRGFRRRDIEALCGEPVSFEHTQFYRTFERYPRHAHFERYSALLDAMPCERLNQALLITGAAVRFPFWDRATDRYIRHLRTDFRTAPGEPKRILRALLARYVPPAIWDLPKHSFDFPLHDFLAGDDHALVRRHLDRERWQAFGVLQPQAVWQLAQQFIAGDRRLMFRICALVMLGAWLQAHDGLR